MRGHHADFVDDVYLSWLNLVTRLTSASRLTAQTKKAELESDAFAAEKKPNIASSTYSSDGSNVSVAPTLDEDEIQELLKLLPGTLTGQFQPQSSSDEHMSPASAVARATGLERLVTSMSGVDGPATQLYQTDDSSALTGLKRHRYNLAVLANQIFGEASSHLPSAAASGQHLSEEHKGKDPQKTISLHPAVSLVNLPRVVLPIVGISTIPQSILGLAGSSGVPMALLQLKFGGSDDARAEPADGPLPLSDFSPVPSQSTLPANPHHDYRIRHTASVHNRAKQIYDRAALKSPDVDPWCPRHRVQRCTVCSDTALVAKKKSLQGRKSRDAPVVPGDGLAYFKDDFILSSGRRRPLARSLADFLILAADAFHLMAVGSEEACERDNSNNRAEFTPLATFYELVVDFVTQAVLEGYTIHAWKGKEALEVLFSVGTGTWEERKWADIPSSWTTPAASTMPSRCASPTPDSEDSGSSSAASSSRGGSPSSSACETSAVSENLDNIGDPRYHLIRAATELFRTRTPAQAEFEREMRDRMHEVCLLLFQLLFSHLLLTFSCLKFLDVPEDSTLERHLRELGAKYPLSVFEDRMLSFFAAVEALLGKPALVKVSQLLHCNPCFILLTILLFISQNTQKVKGNSSAPVSPALQTTTLDFTPLEHFASRFSWADLERAAGAGPSSIGKRSATPPAAEGKRRRT